MGEWLSVLTAKCEFKCCSKSCLYILSALLGGGGGGGGGDESITSSSVRLCQ